MTVNVNDKIRKLNAAQRNRVESRAAQLIAEEMTLRELRHARKLTQVRMAKKLGVTQDSVSRLEKRSDLLLSTLRKAVEAMGGSLSLIAEFPDHAPVLLSGIAEERSETAKLSPRPSSRFPETRLEEVVGSLRSNRKAASLAKMDAAIAREVVRRHVRVRT